jgi:hypothetical protein
MENYEIEYLRNWKAELESLIQEIDNKEKE